MPDKNNPNKAIDFSHLGGRQIQAPFMPEESTGKIFFKHIGGRCVWQAPNASEEKDGEANTD